ncbi:mechanosensitive ion channel family protein [Shewanella intestini]|uniref:Mechanosensitive ion channel family protein n=1 Tax=Shewanella intestini TaxID=2017544 RepID=A0ABS5I461_9GAMM|nr:mechanosensitive ion channel family protein [Shewanella sp. XMDDZSB0408]MBR9728613.1 mechanosensitive ion channel family protein [Shewanella intestini]MRG37331.1 mechanosensitive ion channel [Shewanella sp. XMDDZSB0408]
MNIDLRVELTRWLTSIGINAQPSDWLTTSIIIVVCLLCAGLSYYFTQKFVVRVINLVIKRSSITWDDIFVSRGVFERLALFVPVLLLDLIVPIVLTEHELMSEFFDRSLSALLVIITIRAIYAALNAVDDISDNNRMNRRIPVKSFVQLIKLFLFIIGFIVVVAIVSDKSPIYFFSGLGVATGLVMLVFRDTILGFVAGIQLAANRMVSKGDWIQMDKYGADGEVIDVTLTTVKVQNWDKTITMIPAYSLVSDAFKNWQGMSESGGRRIKRAVNIDINSIGFLSEADIERLQKVNCLKSYLPKIIAEISSGNADVADPDMLINGRHLTNIGTFRAYLQAFLDQHPKVRKDMTLMVRQLAPTTQGVPIEVYIFSNDTVWFNYEGIQGDIFDHIFAVLPEFGLHAYQQPTGQELGALLTIPKA